MKETKCDNLGMEVDETPREFYKLSQYIEIESDKGNMTLKLEANGVKTLALLDIGTKVIIITKDV